MAANHSLARTAQPDDEGLSAGSARVPTLRLLFGKSRGIVASSPGMGGLGLLGALPIRWRLDRPHALQIGRGAPSDEVCLADDSQASRLHASLLVVPGQPPLLRDLGSSNGTFVNGARIQQASLCDGDVVRVGSTLFLLREEPQPCPDAQVPSLIGQSPAICHLRHEVALWAPSLCTVLLLGDARNNYHASQAWVIKEMRQKARHVYWLNPEPRSYWNTGDSIVGDYGTHTDGVYECRNLRQLEAFVEKPILDGVSREVLRVADQVLDVELGRAPETHRATVSRTRGSSNPRWPPP